MRETSSQPVNQSNALKLAPIGDLAGRTREVQDLIAERAHQLARCARRQGDDVDEWWRDWVRAESEVLFPVEADFRETAGQIEVLLEVPGFSAAELELAIDPLCLAISGKRKSGHSLGKRDPGERPVSSQIFRVLNLPGQIDPSGMTANLVEGRLTLRLPKANQNGGVPGERQPDTCPESRTQLDRLASCALLLLA